ncbi:hypothetical protein [Nonomuraea sp. SBT364]|uniref:hypothetical protein n=1 Tax=Nonomuraea sp. SBT364 TaxID=1580530 RepID=UPI001E61436D|nr:hypothetical protein [Nonomuraea sp. SBT364]
MHELPGTTFSNPAERGSYDSQASAVLTVAELNRWLALAAAAYHGQVHSTLGQTPAGRWTEGIAADGRPATVTSETAFLIDHAGRSSAAWRRPRREQLRRHLHRRSRGARTGSRCGRSR